MDFNSIQDILTLIGVLGIPGILFWFYKDRKKRKNELKEVVFDRLAFSKNDFYFFLDITIRNPTNHIVTLTSFLVRSRIKNDDRVTISSVTRVSTQYQVLIARDNSYKVKEGNNEIGIAEAFMTPRSHYFNGPLVQEIAPNSVDRFQIKVDLLFIKDDHNNIDVEIDYNIKNLNQKVSRDVDY